MGAGQSNIIDQHADILKQTKNTREIVNSIFTFMNNEVALKDFYKLTSPDECKKYLIVMTDFLDKVFSRLQLVPIKDKKGVIFFRKYEELKDDKDSDLNRIKQANCLLLAFFYIRIFQIYGALALSVLDEAEILTPTFVEKEGTKVYRPRAIGFQGGGPDGQITSNTFGVPSIPPIPAVPQVQPQALAQGFVGYQPVYGAIPGGVALSGTSSSVQLFKDIDPFAFFNDLGPQSIPGQSYKFKFSQVQPNFLREAETALQIFTPSQPRGDPQKKSDFGITYDISGPIFMDSLVDITLRIVPNTQGTFDRKGVLEIQLQNKQGMRTINIDLESSGSISQSGSDETITFLIKGVTIPNSPLQNFKNHPMKYQYGIRKMADGKYIIKDLSVKKFLEMALYKILCSVDVIPYIKPNIKISDTAKFFDKVKEGRDELDISSLVNLLSKEKRPRAYCISRGLQLLSTAQNLELRTGVCVDSFAGYGDELSYYANSVPIPGSPIDSAVGINSLASLFKDTFDTLDLIKTPGIVMSQPALERYQQFIQTMSELFSDPAQPQAKPKEIRDVRDDRSEKACTDIQHGPIKINIKTVSPSVLNSIKSLFAQQLTHTKRVGELLGKLFVRAKSKSGLIETFLNPNLMKLGFPYLQEVNRNAFNLLANYYENCEKTYSLGQAEMIKLLKPPPPPPSPGSSQPSQVATLPPKTNQIQKPQTNLTIPQITNNRISLREKLQEYELQKSQLIKDIKHSMTAIKSAQDYSQTIESTWKNRTNTSAIAYKTNAAKRLQNEKNRLSSRQKQLEDLQVEINKLQLKLNN